MLHIGPLNVHTELLLCLSPVLLKYVVCFSPPVIFQMSYSTDVGLKPLSHDPFQLKAVPTWLLNSSTKEWFRLFGLFHSITSRGENKSVKLLGWNKLKVKVKETQRFLFLLFSVCHSIARHTLKYYCKQKGMFFCEGDSKKLRDEF